MIADISVFWMLPVGGGGPAGFRRVASGYNTWRRLSLSQDRLALEISS